MGAKNSLTVRINLRPRTKTDMIPMPAEVAPCERTPEASSASMYRPMRAAAYDTYQDGAIAIPPHQTFVLYDLFLGDLLQ